MHAGQRAHSQCQALLRYYLINLLFSTQNLSFFKSMHVYLEQWIVYCRMIRDFANNCFPKIRIYYGSGWEGPGLTRIFWENHPKIAPKKMTEKRLKWYAHVRRMKEEHIVRRMLDVDIPGKRRKWRPNLWWKDACKRDMTQAGLKEDNATNRAQWRKKLIRSKWLRQARDEEDPKIALNKYWYFGVVYNVYSVVYIVKSC